MGMVWEAYHKGVPLLGVPGITLEKGLSSISQSISLNLNSSNFRHLIASQQKKIHAWKTATKWAQKPVRSDGEQLHLQR